MTPNEIKRILFEHEAWLNGSGVRADLRGAKLSGVQYDESTVMLAMACPEKGAFIGYKKAAGYIIELLILDDARRSSATSRKCRCDKAKVISITTLDGREAVNYD